MFGKKILISVFLVVASLLIPSQAHAQSNTDYFDTSLHTTVTVSASGQSQIKHEFTITNKTPTIYISKYGLKVSSSKIQNVNVTSNGKNIPPNIVPIESNQQSGPGQTSISINFPDKIVGEGKVRKFTVSYTYPNAALINGKVLEVTLPPQANPQDYHDYSVTLITPAIFGKPIRTTPNNHTYSTLGNQIITNFNQGEEKGVFALFGSEQIFDLDITYQLNNATNNPGIIQIALPPDTAFQKINYQLLQPRPKKIETDLDGNWIATYELSAGSHVAVHLLATVKLTLEPNTSIPVPTPDNQLLLAQKYWPVNDDSLKKLTKDYTTAQEINDFVVKTLDYNTDIALGSPERLGALKAIKNPDKAVCQEFTDLFVTVARSKGIYARRITGYAYSQNSKLRPLSLVEDVLHAWPEYYDSSKNMWVPIDPTWQDTTGGVDYFHQLDLNHIVFAINGHNSVTPHPAGSYKSHNSSVKTVFVKFGNKFPKHQTSLTIHVKPQKLLNILPLPGSYVIEITNLSGQAEYNLPLTIQNHSDTIQVYNSQASINSLLPFQTLRVPIKISNRHQLKPIRDTITITLQHEAQEFDIISGPFINLLFKRDKIMAVASGIIIATLITGSILVFRQRK